MKIDNLISNLQKNTAEQDRIIKEQAESVTKQHLESYNALLRASSKETEKILRSNLQTIQDQQPKIRNALRLNILTGAVLGVLITVFLIFLGVNWWLAKQIQNKQQELAEINLKVEQTPLEKQILRRVKLHESEDKKTFYIVAKNSKKANAYENTANQMVLKLEK